MSKDKPDVYSEVLKIISASQQEGFESCLEMLKSINENLKRLKYKETLLIQAIITELEGAKEDLFKTENE